MKEECEYDTATELDFFLKIKRHQLISFRNSSRTFFYAATQAGMRRHK